LPQRPEWKLLVHDAARALAAIAPIVRAYVPSDNEAQTERDVPLCQNMITMSFKIITITAGFDFVNEYRIETTDLTTAIINRRRLGATMWAEQSLSCALPYRGHRA